MTLNHISLNSQPEAVRKFVLAIEFSRGGTLLEFDGKPIACILPPETPSFDRVWTDVLNQRRCQLIDKRFETGLTTNENDDLAGLQMQMLRQLASQVRHRMRDWLRRLQRKSRRWV